MKFVSKLMVAGIFAIVSLFANAEDDWLKSVPEFNLTDHLGNSHTLDQYTDKELVVFYVQGNGCPIARIALPNLREVRAEFQDRGIEFIAFNSNIQDSPEAIAREADSTRAAMGEWASAVAGRDAGRPGGRGAGSVLGVSP